MKKILLALFTILFCLTPQVQSESKPSTTEKIKKLLTDNCVVLAGTTAGLGVTLFGVIKTHLINNESLEILARRVTLLAEDHKHRGKNIDVTNRISADWDRFEDCLGLEKKMRWFSYGGAALIVLSVAYGVLRMALTSHSHSPEEE